MNEMPDAEDFITFKRSHFYSALVVLAFAVGLLVGYVLWGRGVTTAAAPVQAQVGGQQPPAGPIAAPTEEPQFIRYEIPTEGFPSYGPADAPITIVEFSDFECPFCRRFHEQTYQALLDAYPGQIRFVYRNLPLTSIHPNAMSAAVASLCANDQNAYWEYHDKLFSSDALGRSVYLRYADELGLDVDEFTACLDSGKHEDFIGQDVNFALSIGVRSTPTFFVNGLELIGAQPLPSFMQLIDSELAGQIP
jgi:protein-disulfide isomerase